VANLQAIRNFLLNKLMQADYDVYQWLKRMLRIEHAKENPFVTQVDYDDRELERLRLQEQARALVQSKKDQLKLRFADEKNKFVNEKKQMFDDIQRDLDELRVETTKYNQKRQQRTRTIVE
jgi:tetraacyldisaccharide-1-P 4'-kinase